MSLAAISVAALVLAVVLSCITTVNVGVLAVALAWIIGVYIGHMPLATVIAGFPTPAVPDARRRHAALHAGPVQRHAGPAGASRRAQLPRQPRRGADHVLRAGGRARVDRPRQHRDRRARGADGDGDRGARAGIPPFLMAIMVGNGANAGSLSPFAPTGIIVNGLMARIGMSGYEMRTYLYNLLAHAVVAFGGYFLFGGWRLFRATTAPRRPTHADGPAPRPADAVRAPTSGSRWR